MLRRMDAPSCLLWLVMTFCIVGLCKSSEGDNDLIYSSCVNECEKTGCIGHSCFPSCKTSVNGAGAVKFKSKCPYDNWVEWDCTSECRYQCMVVREAQRQMDRQPPVKYHGKWPFKRVLTLQEPSSVVFSVINLVLHAHGLVSFLILVHFKLPKRPQGKKGPYYEYCDLWTAYGLASGNSWLWSAAFHARDTSFTEKLDYSSAVALLGLMLMIAVIRTLNLRVEAARVMVAAPIIAFVSTHILYLNFYDFNYGWNMKVCVTMGILQLLLWAFWAGYINHPGRFKLWFVVLMGALAMLLEIYDFPPVWGLLDAHSVWHAATIPLTLLWWSFIKGDARFRTSQLLRKAECMQHDSKKAH